VVLFALLVATSAKASEGTISATISVADLPTTITLCRDPTAYSLNGYDEVWEIFIDVDSNSATGLMGADVAFEVSTHSVGQGTCGPETVPTEQNLDVALFTWDTGSSDFVDSGVTVALVLDFKRSRMILTVPSGGPLAGISANSAIAVEAGAPYTSGATDMIADDFVPNFKFGGAIIAQAFDVQNCQSPCQQSNSWVQSIDLIGASIGDLIFQSQFE
jgi:hypothetical protein